MVTLKGKWLRVPVIQGPRCTVYGWVQHQAELGAPLGSKKSIVLCPSELSQQRAALPEFWPTPHRTLQAYPSTAEVTTGAAAWSQPKARGVCVCVTISEKNLALKKGSLYSGKCSSEMCGMQEFIPKGNHKRTEGWRAAWRAPPPPQSQESRSKEPSP